MAKSKYPSSRGWACPSYALDGRAASAVGQAGESLGWAPAGNAQIGAASGKGQNGAPGTAAMNRSGSADKGRIIYQREG